MPTNKNNPALIPNQSDELNQKRKKLFPAFHYFIHHQGDNELSITWMQQDGKNREKNKFNQLGADNDIEAIMRFLEVYRDSPKTLDAYTREVQRFMLYLMIKRHKSLSSATLKDFTAYEKFIAKPDQDWKGLHGAKQFKDNGAFNPEWGPFTKPLSAASQIMAIKTLNAMMSYLVNAAYLQSNPLALDKLHRESLTKETKKETFHALSQEEWHYVWEYLETLPRNTIGQINEYERLHFILTMFYTTACRAFEFAKSIMGDFKPSPTNSKQWYWHVVGKGKKKSELPANQSLLNALIRYRQHLGLSTLPTNDDTTPLLLSRSGKKPVSQRQLGRILENLFNQVADHIKESEPVLAANIEKATMHWMRHTALSHAARRSNDIRLVQRFGRHSNIRTSGLYIHMEDKELVDLMENQSPES
jgi:site-specific recombinase XerD